MSRKEAAFEELQVRPNSSRCLSLLYFLYDAHRHVRCYLNAISRLLFRPLDRQDLVKRSERKKNVTLPIPLPSISPIINCNKQDRGIVTFTHLIRTVYPSFVEKNVAADRPSSQVGPV